VPWLRAERMAEYEATVAKPYASDEAVVQSSSLAVAVAVTLTEYEIPLHV